MPAKTQNVCRIYTEDIRRAAVVRAVSQSFENFTLQPTTGFYKGRSEKAIIIEIVGARKAQIDALAAKIRVINGQKSVLIIRLYGHVERITRHSKNGPPR